MQDAYKAPSGGPAGVIYGYIFVWLGTLSVFLTLAEATSMWVMGIFGKDLRPLTSYQGPYVRGPISLGLYARSSSIPKVLELHHWFATPFILNI